MVTIAQEFPGPLVKAKLGRDDWTQRGFMLVIALYLFVALALPLYAMLSKAFSIYQFDLTNFEVQVSAEDGSYPTPVTSLATLNASQQAFDARKLATSSDGRLGLTDLFPDFSFRSPVNYRFRGNRLTSRRNLW